MMNKRTRKYMIYSSVSQTQWETFSIFRKLALLLKMIIFSQNNRVMGRGAPKLDSWRWKNVTKIGNQQFLKYWNNNQQHPILIFDMNVNWPVPAWFYASCCCQMIGWSDNCMNEQGYRCSCLSECIFIHSSVFFYKKFRHFINPPKCNYPFKQKCVVVIFYRCSYVVIMAEKCRTVQVEMFHS